MSDIVERLHYLVRHHLDPYTYGPIFQEIIDEITHLRTRVAELEAEKREREWRTIESAPKDGTLVLLFVPGSRILEIVFGRWDTMGNEDWLMDMGESAAPIDIPVTHWQPLPPPPARDTD